MFRPPREQPHLAARRTRMRSLVVVFIVVGCSSPAVPSTATQTPINASSNAPARTSSSPVEDSRAINARDLCLPLVDECGCSFLCARGVRHVEGNQYEVSHAGQGSRLDQATRTRLCFDERGVSSPDDGTRVDVECMDTFQWGACGGECIPSPVPTCRIVDGSCRRLDT